MKKVIKIIFINVAILIGLLWMANFSAVLIYKAELVYKRFVKKENTQSNPDERSKLPNYSNIPWAARHFSEFLSLPSEYRSYIGWRRLPFKGQTITIDTNGVRFTPQHPHVFDSAKIAVFLGGSTMWGTGSDDENTIPAHFAKLGNGFYKTINFGETGYDAFQAFVFLQLQIMNGFRPDIVVSYCGVNNFFDPSLRRPYSHQREKQIQKLMKGQDRKNPSDEILSFRHFFLSPLKTFFDEHKSKPKAIENNIISFSDNQNKIRKIAEELLESWLATKHLADQYNAVFVAVLQPNVFVGNPKKNYLKMEEDKKNWYLYYPLIFDLLKEPKYQELSGCFLDLSNAFDKDEFIFIDWSHVSPNGNFIIANKILKFLEKRNQKS